MCLNVFLAADRPLPIVDWNPDEPGFHVRSASARETAAIRHAVRGRYLFYAGSHDGCGCGFLHHWASAGGHLSAEPHPGPKRESAVRSTASLVDYLRRTAAGGPVELYSCWQGDEAASPLAEIALAPDSLDVSSFVVREGERVTIGPAD